MKSYRLDKQMTEQEIDDFFDRLWIDVDFWTEGSGRATVNYEILRNDDVHILKSEHYSFGGYAEPTYNFITMDYTEFKEELDHDVYDKVYEVLSTDYNKLLQCFHVWVDVNRYHDVPIPKDCRDFYDWNSLVYCTISNSHLTQHIFNFNLE